MKKRISYYVWTLIKDVLARMQQDMAPYPAYAQRQTRIREHLQQLRDHLATTTPEHPAMHGFKVFSQADEDGIIEYLLDLLPSSASTKTFIEVGCGDGIENNSHYLLLRGYRGVWVDGSPENIGRIHSQLGRYDSRRLLISQSFIDLDNIKALTAEWLAFVGTSEPDFLSLDIDGNDAYVLLAMLELTNPRIICVEYNAKFPPTLAISTSYDKHRIWSGDDYQGASLGYFCRILTDYSLVACNLAGTNAFFVRNDLKHHYPQHSIEALYQPFRSELCLLQPGHRPSLKWLRDELRQEDR